MSPLRSDLLSGHGFEHGFSLRHGTPNPLPAPGPVYQVNQVHGRTVVIARSGEAVEALRARDADALVAGPDKLAVGVRTADCLAVLLADPATGAVAAIHAGWRGTVTGVVEAAVEALDGFSGARSGWVAATLPHIRACCFEVGDDVADQLAATVPKGDVVVRAGSRPHVDLRAIVAHKLERLGISSENLDDVRGCTRCDTGRFFSYRRDGAGAGRHLAAIVSRG